MGQLQIRRPSGLDEATFASFDGQDYDSNTLNTNTYKNLKLIQFLTTWSYSLFYLLFISLLFAGV